MAGVNIAEPPKTEIRMSIPKVLTVIPVLKIYDVMGNMQNYIMSGSDDDCDETEKFESPKLPNYLYLLNIRKGL